jgi:hypothetical protein
MMTTKMMMAHEARRKARTMTAEFGLLRISGGTCFITAEFGLLRISGGTC